MNENSTFESLIRVDMINWRSAVYSVDLSFGSQKAMGNVLIDTGSPTLTIAGTSNICQTCSRGIYDPQMSSTAVSQHSGTKSLVYGSLDLQGQYYTDSVRFNTEEVNYSIFVISQQTGLNPSLDGILGLGYGQTPSFVPTLKASGIIDDAIVSISTGFQGQSFLEFGSVDHS